MLFSDWTRSDERVSGRVVSFIHQTLWIKDDKLRSSEAKEVKGIERYTFPWTSTLDFIAPLSDSPFTPDREPCSGNTFILEIPKPSTTQENYLTEIGGS